MLTPTLLALALALAHAPAATPPPKGSWVVLVKSDEELPADWKDEIQKAAERAAQQNDDVSVVPPPQVGISDLQLALSCEAWEASCVGKVASMMNADHALSLLVAGGDAPRLSWTVVRRDGNTLLTGGPEQLPDLGDDGLVAVRSRLRSIIVGVPPTVLVVETDIPGADLFIDGQRVGQTPYTLRDLDPGPHKLRLELDGRAPLTRDITVEEGRTERRAFVLSSTTTPAHDPVVGTSDPAPLSVSPLLAFGVLGAGVGIAALGWVAYAVHFGLFMLYQPQPNEKMPDFDARTAGLPDRDLAMTASYISYAAFVTVFAVGLLTAASGSGLVAASLILPGE